MVDGHPDADDLLNPLKIYPSPTSSIVPKNAHEEARLLASGIFNVLAGRPYLVALWFCGRSLIQHWNVPFAASIEILPTSTLRLLFGMRQKVHATIKELEIMRRSVEPIDEFRPFVEPEMTKQLTRAMTALRRFVKIAQGEPSRRAIRQWASAERRLAWPFRPPALAYALFRLLREYSRPRMKADDAYDLIGKFEKDFLGHKIGDTVEVVRRQVRIFKKSSLRGNSDRILRQILSADWSDGPDHR